MTESLSALSPGQSTRAEALWLSRLSLTQFRNYDEAVIETGPDPVALTGRNGAGKTNILEAISLLTPGRGLRRAKLSELDTRETGGAWSIAARLHGRQGETRIGTGRDPESPEGDKRLIRIDGKPQRGQAELARHLSVLWLTPQMEQLFQEGASAGRKFLDRLVYSFDAEHVTRVNAYDFAMRDRNRLLQDGRADTAWLDTLEAAMAESAAAIAQARAHTVEHLNHAIGQSELSFPKARLAVSGFMEDLLQQGRPAVEAEQAFQHTLGQNRRQDGFAGRTTLGTHRSALQVTHREKSMPAESCSTGEQKAMLLSITLSQARAGAIWHGMVPILLLDEVVAHLDASRRQELFEEINALGAQVWMTGTDRSLFAGMEGRAQFLTVENGRLNTA